MLMRCLLQTYFLPVIGLVEPTDLSPGDLVVSPAYFILDALPSFFTDYALARV